jgi:aminoglycoside/choline kinase family phosphotransferase
MVDFARYRPWLPILAGADFEEVAGFEPLRSDQRNLICRATLRGRTGKSVFIAKFYDPAIDRFFDHHYRREEKILTLLNRWFGAHTPRVYGGLLVEEQVALLLMEDAGARNLGGALVASTGAAHRAALQAGVELLSAFHRVTDEHRATFVRIVQSIDLDRLSGPVYRRRLAVALGRMHRTPPRGFYADFARAIIRPLLAAPRGIVHNSFSPQHVILGESASPAASGADGLQTPRLIDFETVAVGPAQIDLAELLEAPAVRLDAREKLDLVRGYYREVARTRGESWRDFVRAYQCATVVRSLDYAGTTTLRHVQALEQDDAPGAQVALERRTAYLRGAVRALEALGEGRLADVLSVEF